MIQRLAGIQLKFLLWCLSLRSTQRPASKWATSEVDRKMRYENSPTSAQLYAPFPVWPTTGVHVTTLRRKQEIFLTTAVGRFH